MKLDVTILGCGSSGGVPRLGGQWGACNPDNPRNYRTRCSILVQAWSGDQSVTDDQKTTLLIDTSPDVRTQLLKIGIRHLDAIAYTHDHADQSHGIDDVRALAYLMQNRIPTWMDLQTKDLLTDRFDYVFEMPDGKYHPAILEPRDIIEGQAFRVDGPGGSIDVQPLRISHGFITALGFKIGGMIYTPDIHDLSEDIASQIFGADLWIIDALRYHDHPTHFHADKALSWLARTQARRAILTNMHVDLDYETLKDELPAFAEPAFDGMTISLIV